MRKSDAPKSDAFSNFFETFVYIYIQWCAKKWRIFEILSTSKMPHFFAHHCTWCLISFEISSLVVDTMSSSCSFCEKVLALNEIVKLLACIKKMRLNNIPKSGFSIIARASSINSKLQKWALNASPYHSFWNILPCSVFSRHSCLLLIRYCTWNQICLNERYFFYSFVFFRTELKSDITYIQLEKDNFSELTKYNFRQG